MRPGADISAEVDERMGHLKMAVQDSTSHIRGLSVPTS